MTETLGSAAKVRWDKPKDRLNPAKTDEDVRRILMLVVEVREVWGQAVDGGVYPPRTEIGGTRHTGFDDTDPTHSAATRPTQKQLRGAARHAAGLIGEARERLEYAAQVLGASMLRTDPDEWIQYVEKHRAATQER